MLLDNTVSFVIVTYNQEDYVKDAIQSVFSQTFSPIEIIIADDCSTDNTFKIIKSEVETYKGPNQVRVFRNEVNLGLSGNLQNAIRNSTGELLILMAGDDISLPERTSIIVNTWLESNKESLAFFSNVELVDKSLVSKGVLFDDIPDYSQDIKMFVRKNSFFSVRPVTNCWMLGCSAAIDRKLIDRFNTIDSKVMQEDMVFPFRAILLGNLKYIDLILLKYRRHELNMFDPTSIDKSMELFKNSYYIKRQWLRDSFQVRNLSFEIKQVLIKLVFKEFIYQIILTIPFLGIYFYRFLHRSEYKTKNSKLG
jgi:glycosyltransferase involved in cell wall biosynthesis